MRKTKIVATLVMTTAVIGVFLTTTAQTAFCNTSLDYQRIIDYIQAQNLEKPLLLFSETPDEFDHRMNQENLNYLNHNPNLLERIQKRLTASTLDWKLNTSLKRLLIVPEQRRAFASLFEQYCHLAVNKALAVTGLPNPYNQITTLTEPVALASTSGNQKVTAYLVHNIADEYIEEYLFFNPQNSGTKIKIKLSNRVFTGRIGSYSSRLTIKENNRVQFERESFTLWQTYANNPINVLVAPVEETLHIALRESTENAIQSKIAQSRPKSLEAVEHIVDEWMAVEEAIVGGLVAKVMPLVLRHFQPEPEQTQLASSFSERDKHAQYRFLQNGIRVVARMGIQPAVALYTTDPYHFRSLVFPTNIAAPPLPETVAQDG